MHFFFKSSFWFTFSFHEFSAVYSVENSLYVYYLLFGAFRSVGQITITINVLLESISRYLLPGTVLSTLMGITTFILTKVL